MARIVVPRAFYPIVGLWDQASLPIRHCNPQPRPTYPPNHCSGLSHPPQCHGTKTLRRRPGYLRTRDYGIVDDTRDSYLCVYCGPPCKARPGPAGTAGIAPWQGLLPLAPPSRGPEPDWSTASPHSSAITTARLQRLLRSWPAVPANHWCPPPPPGPAMQYDFNPFAEDDELRAMQVQENMKLAVANIFPRPFDSLVTAGEVGRGIGRWLCRLCVGCGIGGLEEWSAGIL